MNNKKDKNTSIYEDGMYQGEYFNSTKEEVPIEAYSSELENDDFHTIMGTKYWVSEVMSTEKDHINPSYYKEVVPGYQYMQIMYHVLGREGYIAHCRGHAFKYLFRCGEKDNRLQELKKASWYLQAAVICLEEGVKSDGNPRLPDEEKEK